MYYAKPIEGKEFQARVDALRAKMAENGIDIVVGHAEELAALGLVDE